MVLQLGSRYRDKLAFDDYGDEEEGEVEAGVIEACYGARDSLLAISVMCKKHFLLWSCNSLLSKS